MRYGPRNLEVLRENGDRGLVAGKGELILMLSWPVFWLGGTFGVMILSLCVVAGDADRQSEEVRFAFLAIAGLWGLSALLGAGMRLSSCEEVAGPPSPAGGVPAMGRRVPPGPWARGGPCQDYHGMIEI